MVIKASKTSSRERELVKMYRALGEPRRLQIVQLLAGEEELSCSDISERLGLTASTLSHHLNQLEEAGLLDVRKSGTYHLIRLRKDAVARYAPAVT